MAKLIKVQIAKITVPKVRITAYYDEDEKKILEQSIDTLGQIVPIMLVGNTDGYTLVDGLNRLEEAKREGKTVVDAIVSGGAEGDALLQNVITSTLKGKTRPSELVAVFQSLAQDYNLDSDQIADRTGTNREWVEKYLKVADTSPEIRDALDKGVIGIGAASELGRLPTFLQQEELLARFQIWKMPIKALKDFIDEVLRQMQNITEAPAPASTPRAEPTYSCDACKTKQDKKDVRMVVMCPGCYTVAWRAAREEIEKQKEPTEVME